MKTTQYLCSIAICSFLLFINSTLSAMEGSPEISVKLHETPSFVCNLHNTIQVLIDAQKLHVIRIMFRVSFFAAKNNEMDKTNIIRMYLSAGVTEHQIESFLCDECDMAKDKVFQYLLKIKQIMATEDEEMKRAEQGWGLDEI